MRRASSFAFWLGFVLAVLLAGIAFAAIWHPKGMLSSTCREDFRCPLHDSTSVTDVERLGALCNRVSQSGALALNSMPAFVVHMEVVREMSTPSLGPKRDLSLLILAIYSRAFPGSSLRNLLDQGHLKVGDVQSNRVKALILSLAASECLELARYNESYEGVSDSMLATADSYLDRARTFDPLEPYPELVSSVVAMVSYERSRARWTGPPPSPKDGLKRSSTSLTRAAVLALLSKRPEDSLLVRKAKNEEDSLAAAAHGHTRIVRATPIAKRGQAAELPIMLCDNLLTLSTHAYQSGAPSPCCETSKGQCAAVEWSDSLLSMDHDRRASAHLRITNRISVLDHVLARRLRHEGTLDEAKRRLLAVCSELRNVDASLTGNYLKYLVQGDRMLDHAGLLMDPDIRPKILSLIRRTSGWARLELMREGWI